LQADDALRMVETLYAQLAARRGSVARCERYFRGEQRLAFASMEWTAFYIDRFAGFSDNWCGVVASAPAERLRVTGFRIGDDLDVRDESESKLLRAWEVNDMDAQSSQGFLQTGIAGRSFVTVWHSGDDTDPVSLSWERPDEVIVAYAPGTARRDRRAALKTWLDPDEEVELATLYTPGELFKFERPLGAAGPGAALWLPPTGRGGGWRRREVSGETWPLPNPLGAVPVVELSNRPVLGREPVSDIEGTIAMQDAINLLWAYLFTAADFASMPARVVLGQEPPKVPILDENGVKVGEKPVDQEALTKGRMLWLSGQSTSIGQWDAAKLDTFTDVINRCVRHVAAQTRTPLHYIVGEMDNVSGETLIALESGLVKKVEEAQLFHSGAVREIFRLAALVQDDSALAAACRTGRVLWADPATRTQAQASDAAVKDRQIGFPFEWIAERRYGLTQAELARVVALRRSEQMSALDGDLAAVFGPKQPAED